MGMFTEFKKFAMRGNLVDMAVAFVIGAAFGKVVTSFISGVVMPPIGKLMGKVDFKDMKYEIQPASGDMPAVAISYGEFITATIDFIIVAFVMFLVVKAMNSVVKKDAETPAGPSNEEVLLTEIRDLLKEKKS